MKRFMVCIGWKGFWASADGFARASFTGKKRGYRWDLLMDDGLLRGFMVTWKWIVDQGFVGYD